MNGITNEMVKEAARKHALSEMGEKQFKQLPTVVKSIADSFIKGVKYTLQVVADKGEIVNLVDEDLEY